jgi:sugar phosphate isomerase/epimerase
MKLGAQFYSIRNLCATPEGLREAFRGIKAIGYDMVQISGIGPLVKATDIAACVEEFDLPVCSTHTPFARIVGETDAVIAEHKLYNCPEIGIGGLGMPESLDTVREKLAALHEAAKKINDAGLRFAFHNHNFEYKDLGGITMFDIMINEYPEFCFIPDVYWITFAGHDPIEFIHANAKRIHTLHFKDMADNEARSICACGTGTIDFKPIFEACKSEGIKNILIEQDNAPDSGDSLGQMAIGYRNIAPLFGKK